MPKVTFLPHEEICPEGKTIEVPEGISVLDAALQHGIELEHACDKSCACTTCHIVVQEGFESLEEASEDEEDLLDKAWSVTLESRLGCQAKVANEDLVIEIPKYTINMVSENHA
jgi:2Fe-2S ferredoxin